MKKFLKSYAFIIFMLPEVLQLLDNFIGMISPSAR